MPKRDETAPWWLGPSFKVFNIGISRRAKEPAGKDALCRFPYDSRRHVVSTSKGGVDAPTGESTVVADFGSSENEKIPWWLGPSYKVFNIGISRRAKTHQSLGLHTASPYNSRRAVGPSQDELDASTGVSTVATECTGCITCRESSELVERNPESSAKSVSFSTIEVREYTRTVGDHPDALIGPPVTIDWEYAEMEVISVDEYEHGRGPRRKLGQMRMHPNVRHRMLMEAGFGKEEVEAAKKLARKVQNQRRRTAVTDEVMPLLVEVEEALQSAKRKMKRRSWRSHDEYLVHS